MINKLLSAFSPITLEQMGAIRLMNRTDTKFVTTEEKLMRLLSAVSNEYYAQEVDTRRVADYYTLYYDTPAREMYLAHHNKRKSRQKLRVRSYMRTTLDFLEVKTKDNHGRTKKVRIALDDFNRAISAGEEIAPTAFHSSRDVPMFLSEYLRYDASEMLPSLENRFNRITLVNKGMTERLTIDTGIRFHNMATDERMDITGLVIIELKRDGAVPSPILPRLNALRIKPMGFSKYCMGMAMTDDALKRNLFNIRLHRLNKMLKQTTN